MASRQVTGVVAVQRPGVAAGLGNQETGHLVTRDQGTWWLAAKDKKGWQFARRDRETASDEGPGNMAAINKGPRHTTKKAGARELTLGA